MTDCLTEGTGTLFFLVTIFVVTMWAWINLKVRR